MKYVVASIEAYRHVRALKIAKTLKELGHEVEIWAAPAVKVKNRYIRAILKYLLGIFSIATRKADVFWIENVPDVIYIMLGLLGKNYIYDRRSPWAIHVYMEFRNKLLFRIADIIERFVMKRAKAIVCVSKGLADDIVEYKKKIYILPNYPDKALKRKVTEDLRQKFNVPKSKKIIIFLAKISITEGAHLLPDVAKAISNENAELWILGDGPANHIVKDLVKKYPKTVKWFGWVEHEKVPNFIAASDFGIVPRSGIPKCVRKYYSHEGIHKISEYLLFGKPVIACGIAPSKYYLLTSEEQFGQYVKKVVRGEISPPPASELTWQEDSIPVIKQIINDLPHLP